MKNKNKKDLKISRINESLPKGISIVIKNEVQQAPEIKTKKKRKTRKKNNKLPNIPAAVPSYMPPSGDGFIRPQNAPSTLNRNLIFPGMPQSLPAPPEVPALPAPPVYPALPAPPVNNNFNFAEMFQRALAPMQFGYQPIDYNVGNPTIEDITDYLTPAQQDVIILKQAEEAIQPQLDKLQLPEAEKEAIKVKAVNATVGKQWGTKDANSLKDNIRYPNNQEYMTNYIKRLKEITENGQINTKFGPKIYSNDEKEKAYEILKKYDTTHANPNIGAAGGAADAVEIRANQIAEIFDPLLLSDAFITSINNITSGKQRKRKFNEKIKKIFIENNITLSDFELKLLYENFNYIVGVNA